MALRSLDRLAVTPVTMLVVMSIVLRARGIARS